MRILIFSALFFLCSCQQQIKQSNEKLHKFHSSLAGIWVVTHAEVIDEPVKFLNSPALKGCEDLSKHYQYTFYDSDRFERKIMGRGNNGDGDMYGRYQIDTVKRQIEWFWSDKYKTTIDTLYFNYVTVNPYKIVMIEPNGVYSVLMILARKDEQ